MKYFIDGQEYKNLNELWAAIIQRVEVERSYGAEELHISIGTDLDEGTIG